MNTILEISEKESRKSQIIVQHCSLRQTDTHTRYTYRMQKGKKKESETARVPKKIDSFRDKYFFLSNFYDCKICYEDEYYASVEHAFQAAKTYDLEVCSRPLFFLSPPPRHPPYLIGIFRSGKKCKGAIHQGRRKGKDRE